MLATDSEHAEIVEVLLDANADPNIAENVRMELARDYSYVMFYVCCFSLYTGSWMDSITFCFKIWQSWHHQTASPQRSKRRDKR